MGRFYDEALIPDEMRRKFDVYDRIKEIGIDLGTFEEKVGSIAGAGLAGAIFSESGLVYLSGAGGGTVSMLDHEELIKLGQEGGREAADQHISTLHWAITCGGEGGDLNDILYTVKVLGMVASPAAAAFLSAPAVINGYSFRLHSVFGGGHSDYAQDGIDPGGFSGVHARSAVGGFAGGWSVEPEIIVAIPSELAKGIIKNRGWIFPLPPNVLKKVLKSRS